MEITPTLERLLTDNVPGKGRTIELIDYLSILREQKTPLSQAQYKVLKEVFNLRAEIVSGIETLYFKTESGDIVTASYSPESGLLLSVKPVEHLRELKMDNRVPIYQ